MNDEVEIKISDVKVIKVDPESPEWKAKIAKLQEQIRQKYDGAEHEETSYKYNKFAK